VLAAASNALVRVLFAPPCVACAIPLDQPLSSPVCPACWRGVLPIPEPWCARCGDALPAPSRGVSSICARCRAQPSVLTAARSAGRYEGALREIIHAFKYGRRRALATPLAALMREAGGDVLAGADAVIPVPLHRWRALQRGFNQADDLARLLGPPVWRVLRRCRAGPPQATLPADRRRSNVQRAFVLRAGPCTTSLSLLAPAPGRWLRHRSLVLIDDVMTTGETMEACGRVLREAGVEQVRGLTAARAVAAPPGSPQPPPGPSTARHR
jgi:ComF family protein